MAQGWWKKGGGGVVMEGEKEGEAGDSGGTSAKVGGGVGTGEGGEGMGRGFKYRTRLGPRAKGDELCGSSFNSRRVKVRPRSRADM